MKLLLEMFKAAGLLVCVLVIKLLFALAIIEFVTPEARGVSNTVYVAAGHSIVAGFGATSFVTQMDLQTGYGTVVSNMGVNGWKVGEHTDAATAISSLENAPVWSKRTVTIMAGDNDIAINDSVASIKGYFTTWAASVRAAYPDAVLVSMCMQRINWGGSTATFEPRWFELNDWLATNTVFDSTVDFRTDSRLTNYTDTTYYDVDEIHLNNTGQGVLALWVKTNLLNNNRLIGSTTYYVRKDGNDANTGASDTATASGSGPGQSGAWLTLAKAETALVSGERVLVGSGRYDEIVTVNGQSNVTYIASTATVTNRGWDVSKALTKVYNFNLNGSNVSVGSAVILGSTAAHNLTFSNISIVGWEAPDATEYWKGVSSLGANCLFDRMTLVDPPGKTVELGGSSTVFRRSTLSNMNGWDIFRMAAGNNIVIQSNTISCSNPNANDNHPDIIQAANDAGDTVIQGLIFEYNTVLEGLDDVQLGNITDDQEDGEIGGWIFRNNLFIDIIRTCNLFAPDVSWYFNDFIRCATAQTDAITIGSSGAGHSNNLKIKNNIFYQCGTSTSASQGWYDGDAVTGLEANYNLVIGTGGGTTKDSSWTSGGQEANGINGSDPDFVSGTDFRLQGVSPCIGAGLTISGITSDIIGQNRPNPPSTGAYEGGTIVRIGNVTILKAVTTKQQ